MQGKTHRLGGTTAALGAYLIADSQGLLIPDVYPALQLALVYPFAHYGATWSDLDHHWGSVPSRDPFSWVQHKILHLGSKPRRMMEKTKGYKKNPVYWLLGLFDAKHRAWQTHSDFTFFAIIGLIWYLVYSQWAVFTGANASIFTLMMTGFGLGVLAHIFLDAITPEGIWMLFPMIIRKVFKIKIPQKFGLVPGGVFMIKDKTGKKPPHDFFATGNEWEAIIYRLLQITSCVLFAIIVYKYLPWEFEYTKIGTLMG